MKFLLAAILASAVLFSGMAQAGQVDPAQVLYRVGNWEIYGQGTDYLDLGVGVFDANSHNDTTTSGAARIEVRFGKKYFFLGPAIGLLANLDDGLFAYGGVYADFVYKRWVFTPLTSAGAYSRGDGADLGGTLQFRTSLSVAYQFKNLSRLGVSIAHMSNANIYDQNPGEEEIYLVLAFPF
ncbi:MAG: acyloxyacyl hydrolase [Desulfuromonadales bacterium]